MAFFRPVSLMAAGGLLCWILFFQAVLLLAGVSPTRVLTLLPLTAYLPSVCALHLLSRAGWLRTAAVWTMGVLLYLVMRVFQKLFLLLAAGIPALSGGWMELFLTGGMLLVGGLLLFWMMRRVRAPFRACLLRTEIDSWLPLCLPMAMLLLLLAYFCASATRPLLLLLLMGTALSMLLVLMRVLTTSETLARMRERERAVETQLQLQRQAYEHVCQQMEVGRAYRHDMRHHLQVASSLARQGEMDELTRYVDALQGKLDGVEAVRYCGNPAVNAVLSHALGRAAQAGCRVDARIRLPEVLPFDAIDLCVVFANALENALDACMRMDGEAGRYIRLWADWKEERRLELAVDNPCELPPSFDADGLPRSKRGEGHGIGLRSVQRVVGRYNGIVRCRWQAGEFQFRAVLFRPAQPVQPAEQPRMSAPLAVSTARPRMLPLGLAVLACALLLGSLPFLSERGADAMTVTGEVAAAGGERTIDFEWRDSALTARTAPLRPVDGVSLPEDPAEEPEPASSAPAVSASSDPSSAAPLSLPPEEAETPLEDGGSSALQQEVRPERPEAGPEIAEPAEPAPDSSRPETDAAPDRPENTAPPAQTPAGPEEGLEAVDDGLEAAIGEMRRLFQQYASQKYQGYVGMDITRMTVRQDDRLLTVAMSATLNAGSSFECTRHFTLDRTTGQLLRLEDLFQPGSPYLETISGEIARQMEARNREEGLDLYFAAGPQGLWGPSERFQRIEADEDFYINAQGQLVISFAEGEVATGAAGSPAFTIPTTLLSGILVRDDLLCSV